MEYSFFGPRTNRAGLRAARQEFIRDGLTVMQAWMAERGNERVPLLMPDMRTRQDVGSFLRASGIEHDHETAIPNWRLAMVGDPWEWIAALDLKFTSPLACAFTLLFRFDTQVALLHEMAHATYLGLTVQEPRLLANGDMLSAGVWVPSPCTGIIRSLELFYEKIPPAYTN